MKILLPTLLAALVFHVAGCSESDDETTADASAQPTADAGQSADASEATPDAAAAVDAGLSSSPEYDDDGCLTSGSASGLCGSGSDGLLCQWAVSCGFTDASQCGIDCTMATTLCLESTQVDACLAAKENPGCDTITACEGWLYFDQ